MVISEPLSMFTGGGPGKERGWVGVKAQTWAHLIGHLFKKGGRLGPGVDCARPRALPSCTLDAGDLYSSSAISARLCLEWYLH